MENEPKPYGYTYYGNTHSLDHVYTIPGLRRALNELGNPKRVFDAGCGNGVVANELAKSGFDVTGVDLSPTGIENASKEYPGLKLSVASLYDDLAAKYGQFPCVYSLEVIEHMYHPRVMAQRLFELTEPGGHAIVSTPYHGYMKNLALALAGKWDWHFMSLTEYGHIKFFSVATITWLLEHAGFTDVRVRRLGRIPPLAKSMLVIARRPLSPVTPPKRKKRFRTGDEGMPAAEIPCYPEVVPMETSKTGMR